MKADAAARNMTWDDYCRAFGIDDSRGAYARKLNERAVSLQPAGIGILFGDLLYSNASDRHE